MNALHTKYVLIGGGIASSTAAQAIRRRDREGSVLLVGQEVHRPYQRPQLSKDYLLGNRPASSLFTQDDHWFATHRVDLRTGRRASHLDPTRHCVTLDSGEEITFDSLLLATGGSPRPLNVPGAQLPNLFYLRTLDHAARLHNAVEKALHEGRPHDHGRGRATVIGAGLLGVELAATFTRLGLAVDLVFGSAYPWPRFAGEATGRFLSAYLEGRGVHLHPRSAPQRLEGDGRVQRIALGDGRSLDCDFAVAALGMVPSKELLRGTTIDAERAILVDDHCRTKDPAIFAAGDCAAMFDPLFGKYRSMDHWESAAAMGAIAGANMAGGNEAYNLVNGFESDAFDIHLRAWGEGRLVERRLVRGNPSLESPDFVELGVAADGRLAQVLAINHAGEDELLRQLVQRRLLVDGREPALTDPRTNLAELL